MRTEFAKRDDAPTQAVAALRDAERRMCELVAVACTNDTNLIIEAVEALDIAVARVLMCEREADRYYASKIS